MRSVVVVLPASIWAMIPMLRVRASGNSRIAGASAIQRFSLEDCRELLESGRKFRFATDGRRPVGGNQPERKGRTSPLPGGDLGGQTPPRLATNGSERTP